MKKQEILLSVILSLLGLVVWIGVSKMSNELEAWDSMYYYQLGLPLIFAAAAIAGYIIPIRPWRWGVSVIVLQPITLFVQSELGPLILIGLLFFFALASLAICFAYLGSMLKKHLIKIK
jgi:hypothetical protein